MITSKSGRYKVFSFYFDDNSLQSLSTELALWKKDALAQKKSDTEENTKYVMDLGLSMKYVSVNVALHFMHLVPKDLVELRLNLEDWKINIKNARKMNLIKGLIGQKYDAKTPSGHPCLWVCVDDEPVENDDGKKVWMLESALRDLLNDGCDPNTYDVNGETLLIHVIKTNKIKSFEYLLDHGVNLELENN